MGEALGEARLPIVVHLGPESPVALILTQAAPRSSVGRPADGPLRASGLEAEDAELVGHRAREECGFFFGDVGGIPDTPPEKRTSSKSNAMKPSTL
jgi:hypothetical protein